MSDIQDHSTQRWLSEEFDYHTVNPPDVVYCKKAPRTVTTTTSASYSKNQLSVLDFHSDTGSHSPMVFTRIWTCDGALGRGSMIDSAITQLCLSSVERGKVDFEFVVLPSKRIPLFHCSIYFHTEG